METLAEEDSVSLGVLLFVRKEDRDGDADADTLDVIEGAKVVVHVASCVAEPDTEDVLDTDTDADALGDGLTYDVYVEDSDGQGVLEGHDVLEGNGVTEGHEVTEILAELEIDTLGDGLAYDEYVDDSDGQGVLEGHAV